MRSQISSGFFVLFFPWGGGGGGGFKHNIFNIFDLMSFVHVSFPINIPAGISSKPYQ